MMWTKVEPVLGAGCTCRLKSTKKVRCCSVACQQVNTTDLSVSSLSIYSEPGKK